MRVIILYEPTVTFQLKFQKNNILRKMLPFKFKGLLTLKKNKAKVRANFDI